MSIASEITRLQTAKSDLKTAIENKGVTVSSEALISDYADYVDEIEGGGSTDENFEHYLNNTLTRVKIPDSVTSLHNYCFSHLTNLEEVDLNNVTTVGDYAFEYTKLNKPFITNNIITFGNYSFRNSQIEKVIFENDVSLGDYVFEQCHSLNKVIFKGNITVNSSLGNELFGLKTAGPLNGGYNIELDTSGTLPSRLFYGYFFKEITLEGTSVLSQYSISGIFPMKKIVLPATLTRIDSNNFQNAFSLANIEFKSATPPTWSTYNDSSRPLVDIIVPKEAVADYKTAFPAQSQFIFDNENIPEYENTVVRVFNASGHTSTEIQDTTLTTSNVPSTRSALYIGKNVTEIGASFHNTQKHCVIPDDNNIQTINRYGLNYLYDDVNLPEIVTIKENGMSNLYGNVQLGNNLTTVENNAFSYCYSDEVVIPDSVTTCQYSIFNYFHGKKVTIGSGITNYLYNQNILGTRYQSEGIADAIIKVSRIPAGMLNQVYYWNIILTNPTYIYQINSANNIYILTATPPELYNNYNSIDNLQGKIYVPASAVETYKTAQNWTSWANKIEAIPQDSEYYVE